MLEWKWKLQHDTLIRAILSDGCVCVCVSLENLHQKCSERSVKIRVLVFIAQGGYPPALGLSLGKTNTDLPKVVTRLCEGEGEIINMRAESKEQESGKIWSPSRTYFS